MRFLLGDDLVQSLYIEIFIHDLFIFRDLLDLPQKLNYRFPCMICFSVFLKNMVLSQAFANTSTMRLVTVVVLDDPLGPMTKARTGHMPSKCGYLLCLNLNSLVPFKGAI